jgi:hypothetical protein
MIIAMIRQTPHKYLNFLSEQLFSDPVIFNPQLCIEKFPDGQMLPRSAEFLMSDSFSRLKAQDIPGKRFEPCTQQAILEGCAAGVRPDIVRIVLCVRGFWIRMREDDGLFRRILSREPTKSFSSVRATV